jgi:hypothetical protein
MQKLPYFLLLPLILISCHVSKDASLSGTVTPLSSIARKPAKLEGQTVQLEGFYLGWKHAGCSFPKSFSAMQITRSDWAFSDGKHCCFVTGSAPPGLDPAASLPVPVRLTATVKRKDSKTYLEFVNIVLKK